MKKIYSFVLMAAMLLIGTNTWADAPHATQLDGDEASVSIDGGSVQYAKTFQDAFDAITNGHSGKITLLKNATQNSALWIGTAEMAASTRSIEIDLNGDTLTLKGSYGFVLTHGTLNITNSAVQKEGVVKHAAAKPKETFMLAGSTLRDVDPSQNGVSYFTHLIIGANVVVDRQFDGNPTSDQYKSAAIAIDDIHGNSFGGFSLNYRTDVYSTSAHNGNKGVANGVRIDIYGTVKGSRYGIKPNGYLGNVQYFEDEVLGGQVSAGGTVNNNNNGSDYKNLNGYKIYPNDDQYAQYIHVHKGSTISALAGIPDGFTPEAGKTVAETWGTPCGIYAGGFARWLVEGEVSGGTGIIIKSGDMVVNNAVVTGLGSYQEATHTTSSNTAQGSAILVLSDASWVGDINMTISGDTKATATTGYALEEDVVISNTEVETINILGGTFVGGNVGTTENPQSGAISISETTKDATQANEAEIVITSATVEGDVYVGDTGGLDDIMGENRVDILIAEDPETHVKTVIVTVPSADPVDYDFDIDDALVNDSVNLSDPSLSNKNQVFDSDTKTVLNLDQLVMTNPTDSVKLTIKEGHTIIAKSVTLGAKAQIIVEPNAALVVTGDEGIISTKYTNIILKANENQQATFLLKPSVTKNAHPKAKVEFQSKSFRNSTGGFNVLQFFGIPTYNGAVANIETESTAQIYFDVWRNTAWDYIGAINVPGDPDVMDHLNKFNAPFGLYAITSKNDIDHKPAFTFYGELTGNMDHTFRLLRDWTTLGNAYMGPIDKTAILDQLDAWYASYGTERSVYFYNQNPSTGTITWEAANAYYLPATGINAMQPMMFHNDHMVDGLVLDYSTLVWDPYIASTSTPAPARRQAVGNITMAKINIASENEADHTVIVEDSELGSDRSFCAPKYNNPGLQLYVMGDKKYDIYAADEIENSYIGYRTVNAGTYTISFEDVQGEELVLIDLANGARTNITEGAIYTFRAEANESNDYRFEIVARKAATAIENTEAVKSVKGVYTITGQYVGEMNVWNTLPAGVYVVNGEKRVK